MSISGFWYKFTKHYVFTNIFEDMRGRRLRSRKTFQSFEFNSTLVSGFFRKMCQLVGFDNISVNMTDRSFDPKNNL